MAKSYGFLANEIWVYKRKRETKLVSLPKKTRKRNKKACVFEREREN